MRAFLFLSSPFYRHVNWGHKGSYNLAKVTQQQAAGMRFSLSLPNCRVRMFSILLPIAQCPWICHYLWNSPFITGKWMNGVGVTDSGIQALPYLLPWYTWWGFNLAVRLLSHSSLHELFESRRCPASVFLPRPFPIQKFLASQAQFRYHQEPCLDQNLKGTLLTCDYLVPPSCPQDYSHWCLGLIHLLLAPWEQIKYHMDLWTFVYIT